VAEVACCERLVYHLDHNCEQHPDPYDCCDAVIVKTKAGTYGLPIHDGSHSHITISHCPWCGSSLPQWQGPLEP
jgi:hypothetical protein